MSEFSGKNGGLPIGSPPFCYLILGNLCFNRKSGQRGILFQIEVWKSQEYFVYFKIFKPISWDERPAERRSRLIQRFPYVLRVN